MTDKQAKELGFRRDPQQPTWWISPRRVRFHESAVRGMDYAMKKAAYELIPAVGTTEKE